MENLLNLVAQFANEVRHGSGDLDSRIRCSEAGQELRARKTRTAITVVGAYLERQPAADLNTSEGDINIALAMLLHNLGRRLGIFIPEELVYGNRAGWVAWAKRVDT